MKPVQPGDIIVNDTYKKIIEKLSLFFGTGTKVLAWLDAPNQQLGNARPIDLIAKGREEKLLKFVETQLEENKR